MILTIVASPEKLHLRHFFTSPYKRDAEVIPLEVKSGKTYERHSALKNVMQNEEYKLQRALVLCNDNIKVEGNITYAPIYMLMFIHCSQRPAQSLYKLELPDFMKQ